MTQSKKKIILLSISFILTICVMAYVGVYALTNINNSTFNVGVKYEPEYLVKVEMGRDGANGGTVNQTIEENEYVEIFNSLNPVSNEIYIQSMSSDTIHINSQTLTPIGVNGDVYFRITSLENETSGNKDLKCVIDCGSSMVDSGTMASGTISNLTIATGIDATSGTVTSSLLDMIEINIQFSQIIILNTIDLKDLKNSNSDYLDFGKLGIVPSEKIAETEFYVSDIDGLLTLSALVGKVNTTTTEYGSNYGYNNSAGPAITFSGATITMLNDIDCENGDNKDNFSKTFISIGNETNSFQGTFDGNNKTITGLYINQTTYYAGLLGYVSNAEIKNLTMQNCKVVSTIDYVGNLVGGADGVIISNCGVEETEVSGNNAVGGIVGIIQGGTATINNCYNTGIVSTSSNAGGIVGFTNTNEINTITNCYNTGNIIAPVNLGGIVGCINFSGTTIVFNCYNKGIITNSGIGENVGGIVGYVRGEATGKIINCYNIGNVSSGKIVGGIVGLVNGKSTITNCFYLKTSSVNSSLNAFGRNDGTIVSGSYYGTFSSGTSNVVKTSSSNLVYSGNILSVLNAYRNANPTYEGITLNGWTTGENGYPVFV